MDETFDMWAVLCGGSEELSILPRYGRMLDAMPGMTVEAAVCLGTLEDNLSALYTTCDVSLCNALESAYQNVLSGLRSAL